MSSYDQLAWFYNKYWTQEAPELFERVLNRIFLPYLPDKAEILDLCCGTGQMCARLSRRLYRMTGLDNSEIMLLMAKENAPAAEFIKGDAVNFSFKHKFDGIVSLFDSLNHILTPDDLLSCFKSARKSLRPDGLFLFDLNDEDTFDHNWEAGFSAVEDDNVCIMKPAFDPQSGKAAYSITTFLKEKGKWQREDVKVYEQYYDENEVFDLLKQAGFHNVQILSGQKDLAVKAFRGRQFFIAS